MAANYWESTQRKHWQFTKDELAKIRQDLEDEDPALVSMYPLPQSRHINIYINQQILRLGKRLGIRQQALATAQIYIKRFYTKIEIRRTNLFLVIATAVYLACKMEECPQHIRLVGQEARSLWPGDLHLNNPGESTAKMGECEFFLISEMNSQLIVHQPYKTLTALQDTFNLHPEEVSLAWSIINDHYMTDLPLLYPPHTIALTAILMALVLRPANASSSSSNQGGSQVSQSGSQTPGSETSSGASRISQSIPSNLAAAQASFAQLRASVSQQQQNSGSGGNGGSTTPTLTPQNSGGLIDMAGSSEYSYGVGGVVGNTTTAKKTPDARFVKFQRFAAWLAESNVDIEAMVDCTQELISFYEVYEVYNDKHTREQISRFIKARGLQ